MSNRGFMGSSYNIMIPLKKGILAYNALKGNLALWREDDMHCYRRIIRGEMANELDETGGTFRELLFGGYIVPQNTNELLILEQAYRMHRFDGATMTLTIAPTMACNFGCDYCFQGKDKSNEAMGAQVKDGIVELVKKNLPNIGHLHFAWYGGEPLLKIPFIESLSDEIIPLCKADGVKYDSMMVTNGYLLDVETAKSLYARGVNLIQVTLDGSPADHDQRRVLLSGKPTFHHIVDNLKQIIDATPVIFSIRVNIDYRNYAGIVELVEYLHKIGLGGRNNFKLHFAPIEALTAGCHGITEFSMKKSEYGQLEADLYWKAYEYGLTSLPYPPRFRGTCAAVKPKGLVILPNGDLHKCWDTVTIPERKIGSIFGLNHGDILEEAARWLGWSPFDIEVCRNCKILPACAGACAYKFLFNQDTMGEAAKLPCISWRYNINEQLIFRAVKAGVISEKDYDPMMIKTDSASLSVAVN